MQHPAFDSPDFGWGNFSRQLTIHALSCDHYTIMTSSFVDEVVAIVEKWARSYMMPSKQRSKIEVSSSTARVAKSFINEEPKLVSTKGHMLGLNNSQNKYS